MFYTVLVLSQTDAVIRVVNQALVVYHTTNRIEELWVLVAVGHLAYVGTASDSVIPLI